MARRSYDPVDILSQIHTWGINLKTRELYLHSYFGGGDDEPGVEYRMATSFVKNLHLLNSMGKENILVHMHCVGGEWNDGMAVYDAIKASQSPVTILAYAQASSMSGVIFQAASKRVMMPNTEFLIHHGTVGMDGHSVAMKSLAEWNDVNCQTMINIFTDRAIGAKHFKDKPRLEVNKFIEDQMLRRVDWFLPATEAVRYGFADGILGEKGYENFDKIRR